MKSVNKMDIKKKLKKKMNQNITWNPNHELLNLNSKLNKSKKIKKAKNLKIYIF